MKILITGGNGYVGRVLCRQAYEHHQVLCLDNLRYGKLRFNESDLEQMQFKNCDIRDKESTKAAITEFQPDAIIHLAAIHFIPECENNPQEAISINVEGTANLADLCPQNCRFVFASTAAVYTPDDYAHNEENSLIGPMDIYGLSKLHAEQYLTYYSNKNGFPAIIARLFNVIGPGETNPHVLPEIFAQLKSGKTNIALGNMSPKRDYISVDDAANAFLILATHSHEISAPLIVNIGTQKQYSVEELVELIKKISDSTIEIIQDQARMRKSDRPYLMANNEKLKTLFNWQQNHTIEDVIRIMWNNPDLPEILTKKYQ